MALIQTKFIAANAVNDTKIRLLNNGWLRARNGTDDGDVNILRVEADNHIHFSVLPRNADIPNADDQLVNKAYVDGVVSGLNIKAPVDAATVAELTSVTYNNGSSGVGAYLESSANATLPAIDGVSLTVGARVLVKNQGDTTSGNALQNGIYVVDSLGSGGSKWKLIRATDADGTPGSEIDHMFTFVSDGNTLSDTGWVLTQHGTITVGTDILTFVQFSAAGVIEAGNGLQKIGNVVSVLPEDYSIAATVSGTSVVRDSTGAVGLTSGGIKVNTDNSTTTIVGNNVIVKNAGITETQINSSALSATGALTGGSGTKLSVNTDNSTTTIVGNNVIVKDAGITEVQFSSGSLSTTGALTGGSGTKLSINVDSSTVGINGSNQLYVPNAGITATQLNTSVAGAGLTGGAGTALSVNAGNGLEISGDDVVVKPDITGGANLAKAIAVSSGGVAVRVDALSIEGDGTTGELKVIVDPAGAVVKGISGLKVQLEATTPTLQINGSNELGVKMDSAGAIVTGASGIKVQLEATNPTLWINGSDQLGVNLVTNGGIVTTSGGIKVNLETSNPTLYMNGSELAVKLDAAGGIVTGASGLKANVDADTITMVGNVITGKKAITEVFTLGSSDLTYIDLGHLCYNNAMILAVDGVVQYNGTDFTLSTAGSVTRVTWAGDLANPLTAQVAAGDKVVVMYNY